MKRTGAWLARYALEQLPIEHIFGIPGVHNTELFDELNSSDKIEPILVTHECNGAFMADAISRVSDKIGCILVVPGAGITHAASGIAEAYLDGIPMLIISGGIRSDSKYAYQLHDIDQHQLLAPITKATFKVDSHELVVATIFEAFSLAIDGEPGPVFVEIPVNIQLDKGELKSLSQFIQTKHDYAVKESDLDQAVALLDGAKNPAIYVGWGAVNATEELIQLAEHLGAPVATTLQGLSSFPSNHPLHCGFGFGQSATPVGQNAFANCDCMLVVGARFSEIATGSYGLKIPNKLIHVDINAQVFDQNYPATVKLHGDSKEITSQLIDKLLFASPKRDSLVMQQNIAKDKSEYRSSWYQIDNSAKVNPVRFFDELRLQFDESGILVVDDGNHTFLTAELMPILSSRSFICPTDFNCMGYATPAAIGAKMSMPDRQVVAVVGDGAFLMSALELATATANQLGLVIFVFNDGQLSQISQAQARPYNRKTCSDLALVQLAGIAQATGCEYIDIENNAALSAQIGHALQLAAESKVVIVDVNIDYSKSTCFTEGTIKTNIKRLPVNTKLRMFSRAVLRKVTKP